MVHELGGAGTWQSLEYNKQIFLGQWSVSFRTSADAVASCKILRWQQRQLLPALGLLTPEVCSRNIVAWGKVFVQSPKVSPRMHGLCMGHKSLVLLFIVEFAAQGKHRVGLAA